MARIAKTIITAEDKSKPGIQSAINNVLDLDGASKQLSKTLTTAFTAAGLVALGKQIADFGINSYKAFAEAERASISFNTALSGRMDISKGALERFNERFSEAFGVDGDAIQGMQTMLIASGRSQDQIEKMMEAANALSLATGEDLNSALDKLNKTFSGSAKELGKVIPGFIDLTKEQLANGKGIDLVVEKYGHLNRTISDSADVKIKNMKNAWADLTEAIGGSVAEWVNPVVEGLGKIFRAWTNAISESNRYREIQKKSTEIRTLEDNQFLKQKRIGDINKELATKGDYPGQELKKERDQLALEVRNITTQIAIQEGEYKKLIAFYQVEIEEKKAAAQASASATIAINNSISSFEGFQLNLNKASLGLGGLTADSLAKIYGKEEPTGYIPQGTLELTPGQQSFSPDAGFDLGLSGIGNFADILSSVTGGMGSFMDTIMGGIMTFSNVMKIMDPIGTILSGIFEVIAPVVNELLAPLVGILRIVGNTIGLLLVPALKFLTPIIDFLTEAFLWLYNKAVVPLANGLILVMGTIKNGIIDVINGILSMIDNINIFGWSPDLSYRIPKTDPKDDFIQEITRTMIKAAGGAAGTTYDPGSLTVGGATTPKTTTPTSGGGASYTGGQAITFNFYNQGNVVGAGGLQELAQIIDTLIRRNARYA
jgi:hypothetical protein